MSEGVKPCLAGVACFEAALGGRLIRDQGDVDARLFVEGRLSAQVPFLARGGGEIGLALNGQLPSPSSNAFETFVFVNALWR